MGCGTVFKLTPASSGWTETVLYTFTGGSDGREPYARLRFDAAGNLYGTTLLGGNINSVCSTGCGTVFKLTHASSGWTENVLYAFTGAADGASPYAGLASDSAGNLYGTAYALALLQAASSSSSSPGSSGWTENVLHAFRGAHDGKYSYGDIILDAAGNLYGTAFQGGTQGYGVVFELSLNSQVAGRRKCSTASAMLHPPIRSQAWSWTRPATSTARLWRAATDFLRNHLRHPLQAFRRPQRHLDLHSDSRLRTRHRRIPSQRRSDPRPSRQYVRNDPGRRSPGIRPGI